MIDDLGTFAAWFPSWTDGAGFPISYRHFVYGMNQVHRLQTRDTLRVAAAGRAARFERDDYLKWREELNAGQ